MLPMPEQDRFRPYSLPWVCLILMSCYLLLLFTWQADEEQQRRKLLDWYQETGLFSMEWDNYLSWLRINGQSQKAEALARARSSGKLMEPFLDMAFNPRFEAENRRRGQDFWSAEGFRHWKEQREEFHQRARTLPRYFAGMVPADARPRRFVTWHFLHRGPVHWGVALLILAPFAWPLEARLGKARMLVLWVLGGVLAGLGPVWLFPQHYHPVIGSTAVVSALIGAFASLFARERLAFAGINPRTRQPAKRHLPALLLLPLGLVLPVYAFMRTDHGPILLSAQLFGLAGGALLAQLVRDTGMQESAADTEEQEQDKARVRALTEGWNALARSDFTAAEQHFQQAREHRPDDFDALTGLFQVRKVTPGAETFQQTLRELLELRPTDSDQGRQRELLLRQLAREQRLPAVADELQLQVAVVLARGGDPQQAEDIVNEALERGCEHSALSRTLHAVADAWERKGHTTRANAARDKGSRVSGTG